MREHTVPCRELGCRRVTWRDDGYCVQHVPSSVGAAVRLPLTGSADADPPSASAHLREQIQETR